MDKEDFKDQIDLFEKEYPQFNNKIWECEVQDVSSILQYRTNGYKGIIIQFFQFTYVIYQPEW